MNFNFYKKVVVISGFFVLFGLGFQQADAYVSNKYENKGKCYLRKEYNYFMNQWTTNEVCSPKIQELPNPQKITQFGNGGNVNTYLNYDDRPAQVTYYSGPTLDQLHTSRSNRNTWNGTGSAANYLLGSYYTWPVNNYSLLPVYTYSSDYFYNYWYPSEYIHTGAWEWYEPAMDRTWNYCGDCTISEMVDKVGGWGNVGDFDF